MIDQTQPELKKIDLVSIYNYKFWSNIVDVMIDRTS